MAKRGRPKGARPSRARAVYRGLNGWTYTIRNEMEAAWKDFRREAGRPGATAAQRAKEHFVDAAALGEMLKVLTVAGFAHLEDRDIEVLGAIDVMRGQLIDQEQALLEAGKYPGPDPDTWYPGAKDQPLAPVKPVVRRRG